MNDNLKKMLQQFKNPEGYVPIVHTIGATICAVLIFTILFAGMAHAAEGDVTLSQHDQIELQKYIDKQAAALDLANRTADAYKHKYLDAEDCVRTQAKQGRTTVLCFNHNTPSFSAVPPPYVEEF